MAVEFHTFTSSEFIRMGAHGELDWDASRRALISIAAAFIDRGTNFAMLDVRDVSGHLTNEQLVSLVQELGRIGFKAHHRLAVLHRPRPRPLADTFAAVAVLCGFDVASFDDYEPAVEWLSTSREEDPDFDRAIYRGPAADNRDPDALPPLD